MSNQRINVKVQTSKLIKALEGALAQRVKDKAQYETEQKQYEIAVKTFERSVESLIGSKKLTLTEVNFRNYGGWRDEGRMVHFEYRIMDDKIVHPERPSYPHVTDSEMHEIKNALSLLKLTDDETVSTSTYNNVARFL